MDTIPSFGDRLGSTFDYGFSGCVSYSCTFLFCGLLMCSHPCSSSADVGYIVWDTIDARKDPAASIQLKVGELFASSNARDWFLIEYFRHMLPSGCTYTF